MKKKILVLTSIYVGEDIPKEFTPVVHYFCKEWVKFGHEVLVVHNIAYYPRFFYLLSFFFSKLIASITGTNIPKKRLVSRIEYNIENVEVIRLPMFKLFPHFRFSKKTIQSQCFNISVKLLKNEFKPDYIIGHWSNPQLELLHYLKNKFTNAKTALIMHDGGESLLKLYKRESSKLMNSIDLWGFRSEPIKNKFETIFGKTENSFMCYSGIPESFVEEKLIKNFKGELNSFLFVGTLIKRKYPIKIIDALLNVYENNNFILNYIGDGNESNKIKKIISDKKLINCIKLNGFLSRDMVWAMMLKTDCFIMISKKEAFGLVYLEAMAAGCITIASRGEGFDGVIKHGENGFLCDAGNEFELTDLLKKINSLSPVEKMRISKNAILTASQLTNYKVAKLYLRNLDDI